MINIGKKLLLATILSNALFAVSQSQAALTIENPSSNLNIFAWGGGATTVYGQTFKLTDDKNRKLDNFTVYLSPIVPIQTDSSFSFDAYVYKWNKQLKRIEGSAVFEQKNVTATGNNSESIPIKINTNKIVLDPNQDYIFFLSALDHPDTPNFGWLAGQDIEGDFLYSHTNAFSNLLNSGWNNYSISDLAYILNFSLFVSPEDAMASMQKNILGLNQIFTMQIDALESSLSQKCSYFNNENFCVSYTAKYSQENQASDVDATSGIVDVAYRITPNFYVGGSLEQIVSDVDYSDVNYRQKAPDVSIYTGWNQKDNNQGLNVHLAYRHSDGIVKIKRDQIESSEAGFGRSDLISNAYQASIGNTFQIKNNALFTPYVAIRHSEIKREGYAEATSDDVLFPLTYDDLSREVTTAILGVKTTTPVSPKVSISGQMGIEKDVDKKFTNYVAHGIEDIEPLDFNSDYQDARLFLSTGIDINFATNQQIGLNVSYRESAFTPSAVTSASIVYQTSF